MYEYLSGTISELAPTHAVLDVGGVGYFLQISLQTYSEIEHSDRVKLFVHYVVREDAQLLYGFASKAERELFRHLISVSGVGGNTARMILSTYSPRELQSIITTENAVLLKNVKARTVDAALLQGRQQGGFVNQPAACGVEIGRASCRERVSSPV